jgi:uncharacterized membrane protein
MAQIQGEIKAAPLFQPGQAAKTIMTFLAARYWIACIVLGGIALIFDLYLLGAPSIWFDEAFSVELAIRHFPLLWQIIFGPEPNMELYYVFLHFWIKCTALFGFLPTELIVRLPSAIFAALSTITLFLLGRRFLGQVAAIIGAGLYLLNNLQLVYAQQTRGYSMQLLLICIGWYALFIAIDPPSGRKRWWICYAAAMSLAIYTQLFSAFILVAQVVTLILIVVLSTEWRWKIGRQWLSILVSLCCIGGASIPLLIASRGGSKTGWLPIPHLRDIYTLFLTISDNSTIFLYAIFCLCLLGAGMVLLASQSHHASLNKLLYNESSAPAVMSRYRLLLPFVIGLVCWIVIPVILSYSISQGSTRLFSSRYLVTIVPPIFLLVGLGIAVLYWRPLQFLMACALLLYALSFVPSYYRSAQVEDWRTVSQWIEQHYQQGDGLVCYNNWQGCQVPLQYYFDAYPGPAHFTRDTPGIYSWKIVGAADASAALDPNALTVFAKNHAHIFFISGRLSGEQDVIQVQKAEHWLDSHFHLIAQRNVGGFSVRLYATT